MRTCIPVFVVKQVTYDGLMAREQNRPKPIVVFWLFDLATWCIKGTTTDTKIDDKTIIQQIGSQAAEALLFIQRHADKGSVIEGGYTKGRWCTLWMPSGKRFAML